MSILLILFVFQFATADEMSCQRAHDRALTACRAHEQTVDAKALSIVSAATRERVVRTEKDKMFSLEEHCRQYQDQCLNVCNDEIDALVLQGEDMGQAVDLLNSCRQGEVNQNLRATKQKLRELDIMLGAAQKGPRVSGSYVKN